MPYPIRKPMFLLTLIAVPAAILAFTCGAPPVFHPEPEGGLPAKGGTNESQGNGVSRVMTDPPSPGTQASGHLDIGAFRGALDDSGTELMGQIRQLMHNPSAGFSEVAWVSGGRPAECAYECVASPTMETGQDGRRTALAKGTIKLELRATVMPASEHGDPRPASYPLEIDAELRASCNGWRSGDGSLDLALSVSGVRVAPEAEGLMIRVTGKEGLAGYMQRMITEQLRHRLNITAPEKPLVGYSRCTSLGIEAHRSTQKPDADRVVWDLAQR